MKSHWITHKGKQILFMDFSGFGLDVAGLTAELNEVNEIIVRQPEKSILGLTDMRNTTISSDVARLFEQSGASGLIQKFGRKSALVDMTGGIRLLIYKSISHAIGMKAKLFDDVESAKDWLAGE
jgi:hypothetical protein